MRDRMAIAQHCDEIYSRNPAFLKANRLNVSLKSTLDHSSYTNLTGDLNTEKLHIRLCWSIGRDEAIAILQEFSTTFSYSDLDPDRYVELGDGSNGQISMMTGIVTTNQTQSIAS